jgi:RNA polymerase sigma-70 factor (ECF subfamily)
MPTVQSPPLATDLRGDPGSGDDDASIVLRAKSDPRAFAPLYLRYFDAVYRYCYRRLGDPDSAADATALVFARALAALPRYRDDAPSFRSWLFAIAHNAITDDLRARRPAASLDAAAEMPALSSSPEDEFLRIETNLRVRALLAELPPEQRHVLELRLAGLTGPEIATALGRSLGSVKIMQVRAFARLRASLTPGDIEAGEGS